MASVLGSSQCYTADQLVGFYMVEKLDFNKLIRTLEKLFLPS